MHTSASLLCAIVSLWLQPGCGTPLVNGQAGSRNGKWEVLYEAPTTREGPSDPATRSSPARVLVGQAEAAWLKPATGRPEDDASLLAQGRKSLPNITTSQSRHAEVLHTISTTATTFREGRVLHRNGNNFVEGLQVRVTAPPFRVRPATSSTNPAHASPTTSTPSTWQTTKPPQPSTTTHNTEQSTSSRPTTGADTRDEEILNLLPQLIEAARYQLQKNGRAEVGNSSGVPPSGERATPSLRITSTSQQASPTDATQSSATSMTLTLSPQQRREHRICIVLEGNEDTLGSALLRGIAEASQRRTESERGTTRLAVERASRTTSPHWETQQRSKGHPTKADIARYDATSKGKARRERGKKLKASRAGQHPDDDDDETNGEDSTNGDADDESNRGGRMPYFSDRIQQHWDHFVGQVKTVAKETWDHLAQQMARSIEVLVQ